MPVRPYVVLSCAMSLDGYIDDASDKRLILSNDDDLDRVDAVRANVDAIVVGAGTVRRDNPRLLVRSPRRQAARIAEGRPPSPIKVVLTGSGDLDPAARLFTDGTGEKIVYAAGSSGSGLAAVATVVPASDPIDPMFVLTDLGSRGVKSVLVEGGSAVLTQFLTHGLVDELQLVVAPLFVGDRRAPRFVGDGRFPFTADNRLSLVDATPIGDCALLTYALPEATA